MNAIVVTEFMDEAALAALRTRHATHYDAALYRAPADIARHAAGAR